MKEIATRYPIFFFSPEDILAKNKGPGLCEQRCDSRWIQNIQPTGAFGCEVQIRGKKN